MYKYLILFLSLYIPFYPKKRDPHPYPILVFHILVTENTVNKEPFLKLDSNL